jgi:hypothetical protein
MAFRLQLNCGTISVCHSGLTARFGPHCGRRPVAECDILLSLPAKGANTVFNCGFQDDRISA